MTGTPPRRDVLFVTGMSGAGKSTALKVLEDLGWEAVDNLPVSLLASLVLSGADEAKDGGVPIAIGIDVRTRDFDAGRLLAELDRIRAAPDVDARLLFLECEDVRLEDRFKTTRRRHPLALDRRVIDGIRQERKLVQPLKERADLLIDTTDKSLPAFRRLMDDRFAGGREPGMTLFVTSFSFARGVPREADLVFDVRFLANPHYVADLQPLSGSDQAVADYIAADPAFQPFFDNLVALLEPLLPRYTDEGKSYLTVAFGCTGGRHRSVFVAERLAARLGGDGWPVRLHHRDLDSE